MARATFIVAEPEPEQALSARKLVLETAKFNVITSHSVSETRELLQQFPSFGCAVLDRRGGAGQLASGHQLFSNWRAMTRRWISLVPSPIVQSFTSR